MRRAADIPMHECRGFTPLLITTVRARVNYYLGSGSFEKDSPLSIVAMEEKKQTCLIHQHRFGKGERHADNRAIHIQESFAFLNTNDHNSSRIGTYSLPYPPHLCHYQFFLSPLATVQPISSIHSQTINENAKIEITTSRLDKLNIVALFD